MGHGRITFPIKNIIQKEGLGSRNFDSIILSNNENKINIIPGKFHGVSLFWIRLTRSDKQVEKRTLLTLFFILIIHYLFFLLVILSGYLPPMKTKTSTRLAFLTILEQFRYGV